ncbi:MAG: PKD domain-containing protein [Alphaproteobacteria bacterium]|nr:PKD domain-containing protein [Alphaproteobacteria bacterium]
MDSDCYGRPVDLTSYAPTDDYFGAAFFDMDEMRDTPVPHRYFHGGFHDTDTRFSFCFPPPAEYADRLLQPLEGANAGHENVNTGPLGQVTGGLEMAFRLGGYTVESNMGHIGDVEDARAGADPTLYGFRAAAECARLSKFVATQLYGTPPAHSYVFGGSGGARRSPLCLAYAPDVWDAALPYMGDAMDGDYGDMSRLRTGTPNFSSMFNVQRVLKDKIWNVVDAMWPGGGGDPFATLNTHQREELAMLYRLGYPRGDEAMIAQPMGQAWLWASMAERLIAGDDYFRAFWSEPGHVGHDQPDLVAADLIDTRTRVKRVLYGNDFNDPRFDAPQYARVRALALTFSAMENSWHIPIAIELEQAPAGHRLGAGVRLLSGAAAGRQLFYMAGEDAIWLCAGAGEAHNLRFTGAEPGDEVQLDNRGFLAFCYYYRHHLLDHLEYDALRLGGKPIYQQYPHPEMSPFMGVPHTGKFEGKMLWVQHTHDASLWPIQGVGMKNNVIRERGDAAEDYFRLRWTENAEHVPPSMAASPPGRNNRTILIDYQPVIEQSLADLIAWVEQGVEPVETAFDLRDGEILLPKDAATRRGIQPVALVTANGAARAEVAVGETVQLVADVAVPQGAGQLIAARWDFDSSGEFAQAETVQPGQTTARFSTTRSFDQPGTYFVTILVESHREGKLDATSRRIPNLASARVVVRA